VRGLLKPMSTLPQAARISGIWETARAGLGGIGGATTRCLRVPAAAVIGEARWPLGTSASFPTISSAAIRLIETSTQLRRLSGNKLNTSDLWFIPS
jgi:hypothetical protein